jgi:hypothetical protein
MATLLRLLFRALLWPVAGWGRALLTLVLLVGGVGWWRFGDQVLRFLGFGRPPERHVELSLESSEDAALVTEHGATWLERYGALDPAALAVAAAARRAQFEAEVEAAFAGLRAAGGGARSEFARGGQVPLPPDRDPTAITKVVLDPREARGSDPVALTLELSREDYGQLYVLRAEVKWLEARIAAAGAPTGVER